MTLLTFHYFAGPMTTSDQKKPNITWIIILAVLGIGAVVAANFFLKSGHEVYVANYTQNDASVTWADQSISLAPNSWQRIEVSDKRTEFVVDQADKERLVTVDIQAISKGLEGDVVLNIGAAGAFIWEQIVYSEDTTMWETVETDYHIQSGAEVLFFEPSDYTLVESPEEIEMSITSEYDLVTQLSAFDYSPLDNCDILYALIDEGEEDVLLSYMEAQIANGYNSPSFIIDYFDTADEFGDFSRANVFLSKHDTKVGEWIELVPLDSDDPLFQVNLANCENELAGLAQADSIVVPSSNIVFELDYPLDTTYYFPRDIAHPDGFSRATLIRELSTVYRFIYADEEAESTIEVTVFEDDGGHKTRNQTDGPYGITDIVYEDLEVGYFEHIYRGDSVVVLPRSFW